MTKIKIEEENVQMSPSTHAECVFDFNYVLVIDSKIPIKDLFDYPQELVQLKQQILQDQKLRELVESVIKEYGDKHNGNGTKALNCSMCFNSKQLQYLLKESKNDC